jgi:hypothetical protein
MSLDPKDQFRDDSCKRHFSSNAVSVYTGVSAISRHIANQIESVDLKSHEDCAEIFRSVEPWAQEGELLRDHILKVGMISAINNGHEVNLIYHNLARFVDGEVVRQSGATKAGKVCISYPGGITVAQANELEIKVQTVMDKFMERNGDKLDPNKPSGISQLLFSVSKILTDLAVNLSSISSKFDIGVKSSTGVTMGGSSDLSRMSKTELYEMKDGRIISEVLERSLNSPEVSESYSFK